MPKPFSVTVIAKQEYQVQVDAIDEAEAEGLACTEVEDGNAEWIGTKETEAVNVTELKPE